MSNIVERLNEIQRHWCVASVETKTVYEVGQICADAKDEIERLREALKFYADKKNWRESCGNTNINVDWGNIARAALGEGKE